jgi:hypothetical protein
LVILFRNACRFLLWLSQPDPWNDSKYERIVVWAYRYHTRLYAASWNGWKLVKRIDITIIGYMSGPGSDIKLAFFFGAVKRDWLLILALQTTFNMHYFFYVVLELVTNWLPYTAAMMIILIKNTIKSFTFLFSV